MAKVFKNYAAIIFVAGLSVSCTTLNKSTAAGAGTGAFAGGIAGSLLPGDSSDKPKNVIVGALAGATIGALGGALIHKNMEDKEREAFEKGKAASLNGSSRGTLTSSSRGSSSRRFSPAKVERRWLDDEVRGNVLIEGHYEQVIVEEGRWE